MGRATAPAGAVHLVAPSGFLSGDRLALLVMRILSKSLGNLKLTWNQPGHRHLRDALLGIALELAYLAANPVRGIREAVATISADLEHRLVRLAENHPEVKVFVYLSAGDLVYPHARLTGLPANVIVFPNGSHDDIYLRPELVINAVSQNLAA